MDPIASFTAALSSVSPGGLGALSSQFESAFAGLGTAGAAASPGIDTGESAVAGGGSVAPAFGQVLSQFLGQVDSSQHGADAMVESLALGEPVDVHQVMLALNQATDALQLTLQVRGKILDAYQEVMKTQV